MGRTERYRDVASTGPRSRERGRITLTICTIHISMCFNGAAFLRTRRELTAYEEGDAFPALQWGRVHKNAERILPLFNHDDFIELLQWGRVPTNAEGVLAKHHQYQRLDSRIASAFPIASRQRPGARQTKSYVSRYQRASGHRVTSRHLAASQAFKMSKNFVSARVHTT